MSIPGRPVIILPGKRPPPVTLDPPDVETALRVLNGECPKVCPACGRPWSSEAPCVCLTPEPVVSLWARACRWWRALWAPPKPRIVYDDELSRPTPPAITSGRMRLTLAADQLTPEFPTARDYAELTRLIGEACAARRRGQEFGALNAGIAALPRKVKDP